MKVLSPSSGFLFMSRFNRMCQVRLLGASGVDVQVGDEGGVGQTA